MKIFNWLRSHAFEVLDIIKAFGIGVIAVIVITSQSGQHHIALNQNKLLQEHTSDIAQIDTLTKANHQLSQQIEDGLNGVHSQINCVLTFFSPSNTNKTSSSISNVNPCIITNASSQGGTTGSNKSGV